MIETLLSNLNRQFNYRAKFGNENAALRTSLASVTQKLVEKHGAELFPHGEVLTNPAQNGLVVVTHHLKSKYTLELAQDVLSSGDIINAIEDALVDEVITELRHLKDEEPEIDFIPFVLIDSHGVSVDPATFQPIITFVTRFARRPKEPHPLLASFDGYYERQIGSKQETINHLVGRMVVERFVARYSRELFPHNRFMQGPVDLVGDEVLTAKSRALNAKLMFPAAIGEDLTGPSLQMFMEANAEVCASNIAAELREEIAREPNTYLIPYMIMSSGVFTSPDGEPTLSFKIRYDSIAKSTFNRGIAKETLESMK